METACTVTTTGRMKERVAWKSQIYSNQPLSRLMKAVG